MANHKSALKRVRQNGKRRLNNKVRKTKIKNLVRSLEEAIAGKNAQKAQEQLKVIQKSIDKTAAKGTLHWKTAARKISRLTRKVNSLANA